MKKIIIGVLIPILYISLNHAAFVPKQEVLGERLMKAVMYNKFDQATELLEKGAPANWKDSFGATPLMMVAAKEETDKTIEMAKKLLEADADVNAQEARGNTVLHYALFRFRPRLIDLLIQYNVNPNVKSKAQQGKTPLMMAVVSGQKEFVEKLLQAGADPTIKDDLGRTAISVAPHDILAVLTVPDGLDHTLAQLTKQLKMLSGILG